MRFRGRTPRSRSLMVELTPMIDVVFLLIVFFMVTSEFARDVRADLELPQLEGEQRPASEEAGLIINIRQDGAILLSVSDDPVDLLQLESRLRASFGEEGTREARVLVRADALASTTRLNEVVRLLHELGVGSTRMGTEVPSQRGTP